MTMTISDNINLQPSLVAAIMLDHEQCSHESIVIQPANNDVAPGLNEVVHFGYDKKQCCLRIAVKSKSDQRVRLELELPEKHPYRQLLEPMEKEMTLCAVGVAQRESEHQLGISPVQLRYFDGLASWNERQQKALAFFLPYQSLIRGDLWLAGKCLEEILQQPVSIRTTASKARMEEGGKIGYNCIGLDFIAGGLSHPPVPCVLVSVGPVASADLPEFIPGGRQRRFLEEAVLPALLPEGWQWDVAVRVPEEHRRFEAGCEEKPLRIDIQSFVL